MKKRDLYYERIPTKLLREDFRLLGTFLGRVIKDQEGLAFFKIVEKFRVLSKNTLSDKNKRKVLSRISSCPWFQTKDFQHQRKQILYQ